MDEKEIKVLVTGASGLLGRTIYKYFTNVEFQSKYPTTNKSGGEKFVWKCLGLCNSRVREGLKKCDISDYSQVENLILEFKVNTTKK